MSFQVSVNAAKQSMVIAVGPSQDHMFLPGTDFGAAYPIYTIDDDMQYGVVLENPVTYLCSDHQTIKPEPCQEAQP